MRVEKTASMELPTLDQLLDLPFFQVVLFGSLALCVIGGLMIAVYVGIRSAVDFRNERKADRLSYETWRADQARQLGDDDR